MMLREVLILTCFRRGCCFLLWVLFDTVDVGGRGSSVPSGCGCKNSSSHSSGNNSRSITCFLDAVVESVDGDVDGDVGTTKSRVSHDSPTFVHNCWVRCKNGVSRSVYDR